MNYKGSQYPVDFTMLLALNVIVITNSESDHLFIHFSLNLTTFANVC